MSCATCSTTLDGHCVHSLAERVAKLEAASLKCGRLSTGIYPGYKCERMMGHQDFGEDNCRGTMNGEPLSWYYEDSVPDTQVGPLASGQLASAGEAPLIPPGWKLAITWHQIDDVDATCDKCDPEEKAAYERMDGNLACAAHAVEMGALVKDELTAPHVCRCKNAPCPACGGDGPSGEWFEGGEVRCDSCGVMLMVATIETCDGRSTFELLDEPDEDEPPAEQPTCVDIAFTCENCGPGAEPDDLGDCVKCKGDLTGVPAEQPSRQETPGGETACPRPPGTNADGSWADGFNPSGPCNRGCGEPNGCRDRSGLGSSGVRWRPCFKSKDNDPCACTQFCADRAKAKAAAQATPRFAGFPPFDQPAEPSGAGQVPSAPVFVEVPGAPFGVAGASAGVPPASTVTVTAPGAELTPSAPVGFRVVGKSCRCSPPLKPGQIVRDADTGKTVEHPASEVNLVRWQYGHYDILEPIAEPPVPAAGTLSERVRALRFPLTLGEARNVDGLADEVAALGVRLAQAKEELGVAQRDLVESTGLVTEYQGKLAQAERERDELADDIEYVRQQHARVVSECRGHQVQLTEEAGKAVSSERARCLAWVQWVSQSTASYGSFMAGMRSGQPAPGTVEPNCATAGKVEP